MDFNVDAYFSFINQQPLPDSDSKSFDHIEYLGNVVKDLISDRIGSLDSSEKTVRFKGNGASSLSFGIRTVTEIKQIRVAKNGYFSGSDFYIMPAGSYYLNTDIGVVYRNSLYVNDPNYADDPYPDDDTQTTFPSNSADVQGNTEFRYVVGYASWDDLPNWIRNGWLIAVTEMKKFMPSVNISFATLAAAERQVVLSVINNLFQPKQSRFVCRTP